MICNNIIMLLHNINEIKICTDPVSAQFAAVRYPAVRHGQSYVAILPVKSGNKAFRHKGSDLFWREVDYTYNLLADELLF